MNPSVTNANDFKVVSFHNSEDFDFSPEMGCMYDGRPINGLSGNPGIAAGESKTVPYHIGHRLAVNLAKMTMLRKAPSTDPAGIPTGVPVWDDAKLESLTKSYMTDLYSEQKPAAMSQTDILMAKVDEYSKLVDKLMTEKQSSAGDGAPKEEASGGKRTYQDKAEVIEELKKRGIKYDARQSKDALEKLIA